MNNKIILVILFLQVGWNIYQQIQLTNKTNESENISSEQTDERTRFLKANNFTLNDANKKIQELENKILVITNNYNNLIAKLQKTDKTNESENISSELVVKRTRFLKEGELTLNDAEKRIQALENKMIINTNNYNKLTTKTNETQTSLNNYIKKQDTTNKKMTSITDGLKSTDEKMKKTIISISEGIPQTYFYGPYYPPTWQWINTPINLSTQQHPSSTKLTIAKKSLVTLSINGNIHTSGQTVQVLFFIDNKPIPEFNAEKNSFYNAYLSNVNGISSLDFSQEIIIQPGTYVFEFGIKCQSCSSSYITMTGIGYTIKVQELPDPIIITNQNF